jgi:hypothetical protein
MDQGAAGGWVAVDPMHTTVGAAVGVAEPVPTIEFRLEALTLGLNVLADAVAGNTAAAESAVAMAAVVAAMATAVTEKLHILEATMHNRDAESAATSAALAVSIDRVLCDQRGAQRDADLAQAHAAHNKTLQSDCTALSTRVKESAAAAVAAEATRMSLVAAVDAERARTVARDVRIADLQRDVEQERGAHQTLKDHLAVPVNRGHRFEDGCVAWMHGLGLGLEVEVTRNTPHRADALVTIPGTGFKVLVDCKNVPNRKQSSDHMNRLIEDADGYAQRGVAIFGVVIIYPDSVAGAEELTDCVARLTKGQTSEDSVGVIPADRKLFCTRRFFLRALFRLAASDACGVDTLNYQDATCARMVTLASRVSNLPLLPILLACEALGKQKPVFKHLQNVHKEFNLERATADGAMGQPRAITGPSTAVASVAEQLGLETTGDTLPEQLKGAITGPSTAEASVAEQLGLGGATAGDTLPEQLKGAMISFTEAHPAMEPALRACGETDIASWARVDSLSKPIDSPTLKRKRG